MLFDGADAGGICAEVCGASLEFRMLGCELDGFADKVNGFVIEGERVDDDGLEGEGTGACVG